MSDLQQTFDGFFKVYQEHLRTSKTQKLAFKRANEDHMENYGAYKYSSYTTFSVLKSRHKK